MPRVIRKVPYCPYQRTACLKFFPQRVTTGGDGTLICSHFLVCNSVAKNRAERVEKRAADAKGNP